MESLVLNECMAELKFSLLTSHYAKRAGWGCLSFYPASWYSYNMITLNMLHEHKKISFLKKKNPICDRY